MNAAAHHKDETNGQEKGRRGMKTDVKEVECCPSRGSTAKKWIVREECTESREPSGRSTATSTKPKRSHGPHHHVKAAVNWCRGICHRAIILGS